MNIAYKVHLTFIVMFTLNIVIVQSCKDKNCSIVYNPIIPIQIFPMSDTFTLRDTLILQGNINSVLQDRKTGDLTNYNKFEFNLFAMLNNYNDTSKEIGDQPSALKSFEIIDIIGAHSNANSGFFMDYVQLNDSFKFKYLLIPKDTGLFAITIFHVGKNSVHGHNEVNITSSSCEEYIEFQWTIFNLVKRIDI